jgi:hypothetical protein
MYNKLYPISGKTFSTKLTEKMISSTLTKTNSISERSCKTDSKIAGNIPRSKSAVNLSNSNFRKKAKKFQRSTTPTKARRGMAYNDHQINYA